MLQEAGPAINVLPVKPAARASRPHLGVDKAEYAEFVATGHVRFADSDDDATPAQLPPPPPQHVGPPSM